jgi:DNA-directed RNA polymerase sigma subunit (sigma70/sigma32)
VGAVDCMDWLRLPYIDRETVTWWQEFDIYKEIKNRRTYIKIGKLPVEKEKIYESPLAEAKRYQNLLNDPLINNQSDIARDLGITRARVSQVMSLLRLAPEIQKTLLGFEDQKMIKFFSEYRLRPLLTISNSNQQVKEFKKMMKIELLLLFIQV